MKLYSIKTEAWSSVFGTPDNPNYGGSSNDCTSVAQKPDCSAFLFLTHTTQDDLEGLTLLDSIPSGYDFTYCQEWGLEVNQTKIDRVIAELS